jgi:glutamate synthase domain-containing protein 1
MCRLAAITSNEYFSPLDNVLALETMKEGHDGSGMGLGMKGLGGEFEGMKDLPVLSCICSKDGYKTLMEYMQKKGFVERHTWEPKTRKVAGVVGRDHYLAKAYEYPEEYRDKDQSVKDDLLLSTRLELKAMGQADESIVVFSFYPDVMILKEIGDPLALGEFFGLDKANIKAKTILAQGRQNTNYAINLYACHPFFLQGYCSMTNGENTAFIPIREYLTGRGHMGYQGYNSDSEVLTHILHYVVRQLGYPLTYYKDAITPLTLKEMEGRKDGDVLKLIKSSLRMLTIDGPNCNIGFLPDGTTFMVQDAKKLRPGAVGGVPGRYALMSEECGVDSAVPKRDKSADIFPMKYDMVIIPPGAKEVKVWNQLTAA